MFLINKRLNKWGIKCESVLDCYKNEQMCDKVIDKYPHALKYLADCYINQRICDKLIILQYNLFLNALRLKKCVIKMLIYVFCIYLYS